MTFTLTQRLSVLSAALLWASLAYATTQKDTWDEVYIYNHYSEHFLCTNSKGDIRESPAPSHCEWKITDISPYKLYPRFRFTFRVPEHSDHYLAVNTLYGAGHRLIVETPQTTGHPLHNWDSEWVTPMIGEYPAGILSIGHPEAKELLPRYFLTYHQGSEIPDRHFQALTSSELSRWHIGLEEHVFDIIPIDTATLHTT